MSVEDTVRLGNYEVHQKLGDGMSAVVHLGIENIGKYDFC